jgi:Sec-independent protein translocase protein TatA
LSEADQKPIVARLKRLPIQLLMALINATAILVIVAALLVVFATMRLQNVAGDVAAVMTKAVLAEVTMRPDGTLANLEKTLANLEHMTTELRALRGALGETAEKYADRREDVIAQLGERLSGLQESIDRLIRAKSLLMDAAIARIGRSVSDVLREFRDCSAASPTELPSS